MKIYDETANVFSFGGQLQSALTALADCQNACSASGTCVGFDWTSPNGCWLHTDNTINSRGSSSRVSQFKQRPCATGLTTPTQKGDAG